MIPFHESYVTRLRLELVTPVYDMTDKESAKHPTALLDPS